MSPPYGSHRLRSAASAFSVSTLLTAKHTLCSEEAWLIMMTLTFESRMTLQGREGREGRGKGAKEG